MTLWSIFDLVKIESELCNYQKKSEAPDLWNDRDQAQQIMKKMADLQEDLDGWRTLQKRAGDTQELVEIGDESLRSELEREVIYLEQVIAQKEINALLSGPYDKTNALLTVNAGAGGTDSQDWAAMLERMYLRYAERMGYATEILDFSEGEEAGIKSVTIAINGRYAYGYLLPEKGVHRLVRLSPFDSAHRRHTSFAQVEVLPDVGEGDPTVKISPDDLRIDIFRSSGAGGQNVQKNATAIRITHIPTGLVVTCQNERSQIQNRENAMRVLRSRLLEIQRQNQETQLAELRGEFIKTEWGSQIRSYVLHPYQMVKDHRTNYETGNTQSVLDGNIEGFVEAYLKSR